MKIEILAEIQRFASSRYHQRYGKCTVFCVLEGIQIIDNNFHYMYLLQLPQSIITNIFFCLTRAVDVPCTIMYCNQ